MTNITHDVKTPLASVKGYSEVLLDPKYDLSSEEQAKYAGTLMDDLKLTYQLKSIPVQKKEENLIDIMREPIIHILNNPRYENTDLQFEAEEEQIPFSCDSLLLQRAVSNLIYNAIVHNPKDTEITVRVKQTEAITIEIQDNGQGIPQKELTKLFERYYRGTNTGELHKGSGLGMAIAKQIIEAHGGRITIDSTLHVGTKITITF
jgi:signal transduction histidine kinase